MTDPTPAPLQTTGYPPGGGGQPPPPGGGGGGGYAPPPPPPPPGGGGFGGGPPGGFGGPPGGFGGLPGGFGGPPGGYGPPPGGGGYGPPPGGGGYGPPPGGGGYGPPPGGFGGQPPPMGYGPVPTTMGAPPQKSGPGAGVFVAIGCLVLLVLGGGVAGFAFFFMARKAATTIAGSLPTSSTSPGTTTGGSTGTGDLKAEVKDLRNFKGDFGKTRHFIGEIYNTGGDPIGFPTAKVTLYDASNVAIDSGTCASFVRVLPPGDKVPCILAVFKADTFATLKVEITPTRSFYRGELAKLDVTDIKLTPKAGFNPHQVDGKITNRSPFKAKSVWAIVSLYGTNGKIVGADQTLIAGNDLEPGTSALFTSKIFNVAEKPETCVVKPIGYSD